MNPTLLLGPGDVNGSSTEDVRLFLERKIPAIPPGGLSYVDARDAAEAMRLAMEKGIGGRRYLARRVQPHASRSSSRGSSACRACAARSSRCRASAPRASRAPARRCSSGSRTRLGVPLPVDPVSLDMAHFYWYLDASLAETELGWTPRDPVETLADTVRDLEERGVVWPDATARASLDPWRHVIDASSTGGARATSVVKPLLVVNPQLGRRRDGAHVRRDARDHRARARPRRRRDDRAPRPRHRSRARGRDRRPSARRSPSAATARSTRSSTASCRRSGAYGTKADATRSASSARAPAATSARRSASSTASTSYLEAIASGRERALDVGKLHRRRQDGPLLRQHPLRRHGRPRRSLRRRRLAHARRQGGVLRRVAEGARQRAARQRAVHRHARRQDRRALAPLVHDRDLQRPLLRRRHEGRADGRDRRRRASSSSRSARPRSSASR